MLTKSQKKAFVLAVRDHADILFAKFDHTTGITKKRKESIWEAIRLYLVGLGAEIPDFKMVRDCEWSNVKRASLKRHEQVKNGEEGVVLKEWDDMVVDIVQRVQGGLLDTPSSSSSFRTSSDQKPVKLENDHEGSGGGGNGRSSGSHNNYNAASYGGNGGYDQDLSNNSDDEDERNNASGFWNQSSSNSFANQMNTIPMAPSPVRATSPHNRFLPHEPQSRDLRILTKRKLRLECQLLQIDLEHKRRKTEADNQKIQLQIQKLKQENEHLLAQAAEVKARTEYFLLATKQMRETGIINHGGPSNHAMGPPQPHPHAMNNTHPHPHHQSPIDAHITTMSM